MLNQNILHLKVEALLLKLQSKLATPISEDEIAIILSELGLQEINFKNDDSELIIANEKFVVDTNKKIAFQNVEKEKRAAELLIANKELAFQNDEKEKRADELFIANKELEFQNNEKEKRANELIIANKELAFQNDEKEKRADELFIANKELAYQNDEKEKRANELIVANKELAFQNKEKENRANELFIANKELAYQNEEKEKRANELIVANKELAFQNKEKENRAAELFIANKELAYQNNEKEKRANELIIANKELAFQNDEKEKRADELFIANKELEFQNDEKEKRAAELIIANKELAFQNKEKENRAAELFIANKELAFQNDEKEKRAAELIVANKELAFQNDEKEKRADELFIANKELAFQNDEKEKRAAELIVANKELAFQNDEKEKRADELFIANKELAFQNDEKEKRAAELIVANKELAFQNKEKEKRADELFIANKELAFQNDEKEKRAAELIVANKELAFQNDEKEKRADELFIANKELAFQNDEKEKRAAELIVANKELAFQNDEKEKRADELIIAKQQAEESDRLKSAFLGNMSHEIRTPMNGILGFAELLREPLLEDKKRLEYIKIIEKSGIRMLNMINDIMIVSKVESGQIEVRLSEKNINLQLENLHKFYENELNHRKINFIIDQELLNSRKIIVTDHDKVFTILTNLVNNAIKFTKIGSIEVGYAEREGVLEYFVKDTGYGINKSQQKMIFERFRRVNETIIRNYEGSGLGLTISKAFTEILGGKIWVESEKGKGSTFFFTVPILPENKISKTDVIDVFPEEKSKKTIKDLKILIVEDDTISNLLISIAVEKYAKVILKANNGLEAIETYINNHTIDLILMDINMPIMDGYEAAKQIRKFNKNIIIIAQTANGMPSDRNDAIAAGCNDYISKPINIVALEALIQKYF